MSHGGICTITIFSTERVPVQSLGIVLMASDLQNTSLHCELKVALELL